MHDLRSLVETLERADELTRIAKPVDPCFELAALAVQLEKRGKAYIFEHVKGADLPLVGGLLSNPARLGLAIGQNPQGYSHRQHAARFGQALQNPLPHKVVDTAPHKELVLTGDAIDLGKLPVPTFFELDSGPFMTGAVGISRDVEQGRLNVGFYRCLITGSGSLVVNASSMSDLRRIYARARERGEEMPIALAIGVPPALLMAAAGKTPPGVSELDIAGALMGQPLEMVKAEHSDLLVPASAEVVIEGTVNLGQWIENTLGEFADQYGPESAPVTRITAITRRRDAMFYSIMAGRNPEHNTIGAISTYGMQKVVADNLRSQFPSIHDINVACEPRLGAMLHMFISIRKSSDAEPPRLLEAAFNATAGIFPVSMITKRIVIVDADVDVHDLEQVEWAIWTRLARADQLQVKPGVKSWELERCVDDNMESVRVGIDATMAMHDVSKLMRPVIPGMDRVRLDDYLD